MISRKIYFILMIAAFVSCKSGYDHGTDSQYETINGCKRMVSQKTLDRNADDWTEWKKVYSNFPKETCDFSSYIIYYKKYRNTRLVEETQYYAGCDQCEEKPCGSWKYYDNFERLIKTVEHGVCDMEQFHKQ